MTIGAAATPGFVADACFSLEPGRAEPFEELARAAFAFQVANNPVYRRFCGDHAWEGWQSAPFLPVAAFKETAVTSFDPDEAERVFLSSATGSGRRSRHYVRSLALYRESVETHFRRRFGSGPLTLVAHLPRYTEQGDTSSLLYMVEHLIQAFGDAHSGFFLDDLGPLRAAEKHSHASGTRLVLFGAAFGLLDLVESAAISLPENAVVIETGGMKTHRREIGREALHARLSEGLGVPADHIFSEYGMCELLSQCYTEGGAIFYPPPWMRFCVVDPEFPLRRLADGEAGILAVFDLANVYSVCAILTEDRAVAQGGGFEVLGRLSGSDLRGCNFLLASARIDA